MVCLSGNTIALISLRCWTWKNIKVFVSSAYIYGNKQLKLIFKASNDLRIKKDAVS